jgi:phosphatidate cytidylyltransferase
MKRLLTAAVALPLIVYAIWSSQPYVFYAIVAVAVLAAVHELFFIAERAGAPPFRVVGYAAAAAVLVIPVFAPPETSAVALVAMTIALMLWTLARVGEKSRVLVSAGATALAVLYVAFLASYLVALRSLSAPGVAARLLTLLLAIVMVGDSAAYYSGRTLGRHKLAPRVSPAKTIEGSIGGLVGSVAAAVASKYIYFPELALPEAAALGAVVGAVGQLGDLVESLLKRGSDVKDAASILPGHGGFLDRLDSILFNAPIVYYYYVLILGRHAG